MSTPSPGHTDEPPRNKVLALGKDYVFTEEEMRVLRECQMESVWYRGVPFAVGGMAITQALVSGGFLRPTRRFGGFPYVAIAGLSLFYIGKLSYLKVCEEKLQRLENSPIGDALRQRPMFSQQYSRGRRSEMDDADTSMQSQNTTYQSDSQSQTFAQSGGYGYSSEPVMQAEREQDLSVSDQTYMDEEEPRRKPVLYEDLRLKNRENYEVTLTQKAETLLKPAPKKEPDQPTKEVKKNIYGDAWDE